MTFADLTSLADRAALFTALRQDQLAAATEALGEHRWDVDLAAGRFTFTAESDAGRTLTARPHLVASIAPGPRSLMWAWALPQGDPSGVATRLREYGEQHGIPELTQGEVPFPEDTGDDLQEWITGFAHVIGGVAVELSGLSPYYTASTGGSRVVLLLDAPLEPLTVSAAASALPRILTGLALPDARTSVWDLARLASWQLEWADADYSAATVTDASGSATFSFDEYARITDIRSRLGG
ncbi:MULTISPECIES: DUF6882 domain-containing protein [Microbacterium]|uniref:DUF6882 domain-containing protein n=1 Tax=Microbacterium TaxID=33882 RepID=UPI00217E6960|nr:MULTISPECIES: DUF6882 domain-containing protein [Microbacterium]UWF77971.1 hypothetical protein JSY13_02650 [Microbacterium neungamense]WCM56148.1 hypothetical protein JRG78_02695 [Microbacterium sp. EF45047]